MKLRTILSSVQEKLLEVFFIFFAIWWQRMTVHQQNVQVDCFEK